WVEVLGCGAIKKEILDRGLGPDSGLHGWAFGIGLERLAMQLFEIDDIRLFWSTDKRFLDQFADGELKKFEPFSNYPPVFKDISFWIEDYTKFDLNRFFEICREISTDCLESIEMKDEFF
ncbi:phenylalanyl-tRNA synthetase, putative, partial [Perkinsus marinus ATCC 50983]